MNSPPPPTLDIGKTPTLLTNALLSMDVHTIVA